MSLQIVYTDAKQKNDTVGTGSISSWLDRHLSFNARVRFRLYKMIAVRMRQNATFERILTLYARQLRRRGKTSVPRILDDVLYRITSDGVNYAEALRPYIPDDEYMMIYAGTKASDIPGAMERICDVKTRTGVILASARKMATQPLLYLGIIVLYLYTITRFVIPSLLVGITMSKTDSIALDILLFASKLASPVNTVLILSTLSFTVIGMWLSLPRLTGPARTFMEKLPPWSIYRNIQGYIWMSSFIALVQSGVPEAEALKNQIDRANPWLKERLSGILYNLKHHGGSLPDAMWETGLSFPSPEMIDDIESCWGGKGAYERLLEASKNWADEIQIATTEQTKYLQSGFTILMMSVLGGLMIASEMVGRDMMNIGNLH